MIVQDLINKLQDKIKKHPELKYSPVLMEAFELFDDETNKEVKEVDIDPWNRVLLS